MSHIAACSEKAGWSPEEIAQNFSLTLAEVHAALTYYFDHLDEIRAEWREAARRGAARRSRSSSHHGCPRLPDTKVRYYFDESFMGPVAKGLRLRGIDVVTVEDLGLKGALDEEHLTRAAADQRVLATMDDGFLVLHNRTEHWGIVYAPMGERSIGYLVRTLQRIHDEMTPDELRNRVESI